MAQKIQEGISSMPKKYDISGWATKSNIECTDGRIINPDAFAHMDGKRVPLVWNHEAVSMDSVFGHADLSSRDGDIFANVKFNNTPAGDTARELIEAGDVDAFSIYAKNVIQHGANVIKGDIAELSLVLTPANPGAVITEIGFLHSDGVTGNEMLIDYNVQFKHGEDAEDIPEKTLQEVVNTMDEEQFNATVYLVDLALQSGSDAEFQQSAFGREDKKEDEEKDKDTSKSGDDPEKGEGSKEDEDQKKETEVKHSGGQNMSRINNVFEQNNGKPLAAAAGAISPMFAHGAYDKIMAQAVENHTSFKHALKSALTNTEFLHADHAPGTGPSMKLNYGIRNVEILFPEATVVGGIQQDTNDDEWVQKVISGTRKAPFSRIKTQVHDMTDAKARAMGYITGDEKAEIFFELTERETHPQTIYVKSRLDRDNIIDATQLNVVTYNWSFLRTVFFKEMARAILLGDGRTPGDKHKIKEDKIRPVVKEHSLYAYRHNLKVKPGSAEGTTVEDFVDETVRARKKWKGTGRPVMFMSGDLLSELLLVRDKIGRKVFTGIADIATQLRVSEIIELDPLDSCVVNIDGTNLKVEAIMLNMGDYTVGTDAGGQLTSFEDFDIDFNQYKYLMEGRMSGALTKIRSAVIFEYPTTETPQQSAGVDLDNADA